jgi:SAM-dependent methyltransferase
MKDELFLPQPGASETALLWQWYSNISQELKQQFLSDAERSCFIDYYEEAGLLRAWRRAFFRQHFVKTFARASEFLLTGMERPTILDLGCGSGTQSIYFALMGARVIAVDLDTTALSILEKRIMFYENIGGKKLDISIHCADAFKFDYGLHGSIDGIFSLFAFNMMQPSEKLIAAIMPYLSKNTRIAILDGNNDSWLSRLVPSRRRNVWSPPVFESFLEREGFIIRSHEGGITLPPLLWNLPLLHFVEQLDAALNKIWFFPISHLIMAERQ